MGTECIARLCVLAVFRYSVSTENCDYYTLLRVLLLMVRVTPMSSTGCHTLEGCHKLQSCRGKCLFGNNNARFSETARHSRTYVLCSFVWMTFHSVGGAVSAASRTAAGVLLQCCSNSGGDETKMNSNKASILDSSGSASIS